VQKRGSSESGARFFSPLQIVAARKAPSDGHFRSRHPLYAVPLLALVLPFLLLSPSRGEAPTSEVPEEYVNWENTHGSFFAFEIADVQSDRRSEVVQKRARCLQAEGTLFLEKAQTSSWTEKPSCKSLPCCPGADRRFSTVRIARTNRCRAPLRSS